MNKLDLENTNKQNNTNNNGDIANSKSSRTYRNSINMQGNILNNGIGNGLGTPSSKSG